MTEAELPQPSGLTLIIPCYNEVGAIVDTIAQVQTVLDAARPAGGHEIIVVDDGSSDGTRGLLDELAVGADRLRVLHHWRNKGYGASLKTGIASARGEWIAITDADGTYPNERLPDLLAAVGDTVDMAVGARIGKDVRYSKLRAFPKIFLRAYAQWVTREPIPDINSGLRVFRRSLAERHRHILPDGFSFTTTITIASLMEQRRVAFVPISYAPRIGTSKIHPIKDTLRFVALIVRTGMYFAPLRMLSPLLLVGWLGFFASLTVDVFIRADLRELTLMLLTVSLNVTVLGLVADMTRRRTER